MRSANLPFDSAAAALGRDMARELAATDSSIKKAAQEIRLRVGRPVCITTAQGQYECPDITVSRERLENVFLELCGYSVYSVQNELVSGFVTTCSGHRAGFGCSAVYKKGELAGIREISSINLRIAREIHGCSNQLCAMLFSGGLCGAIIVGAPSSGKTTLLRDAARSLADGETGEAVKVVLVDERGELSAVRNGVPGMNVGKCCDILYGYEKSTAINQAIRCLSPQVIVCDEIGSPRDAQALLGCVNAGVSVIASVHAANEQELRRRSHIITLLETGAFKKLVFLQGANNPSGIAKVVNVSDILEDIRSGNDGGSRSRSGA